MKDKVVLVNPDMIDLSAKFPLRTMRKTPPQLPLGLCYLGAVLENNGFKVSIIDNYVKEYTSEVLANKILDKDPQIAAFSTVTQNVVQAFETAEFLKKRDPDIKIVFGGIHSSVLPYDVMKDRNVDFVIVSEGEYTLLELTQALNNSNKSINKIKGLFYRKINGEVVFSGSPQPLDDLDSLPFPSRHLVNLDDYDNMNFIFGLTKNMTINTSRGCPFNCAFCSSSEYWIKKFRARSPSNILEEIEMLKEEYGADGIRFREDNFTTSKKRILNICQEMNKRKINLPWECESRVDTVDKETLQIMFDSGCRGIWFGVESGNQKTLDFLNKGINLEQISNVFKWCREIGILAGATFMVGIPGETRDDTLNTFKFALEIDAKWASFQAYLGLPRSELYEYIIDKKMYCNKIGDIYIVETEHLSFAEIVKFERNFNNEYYRLAVMKKADSKFMKFLIRIFPYFLLSRIITFYKSFSFSFRRKIKRLLNVR